MRVADWRTLFANSEQAKNARRPKLNRLASDAYWARMNDNERPGEEPQL